MIETFPDRRDRLFGREADIHRLTDRAARAGLTAVVARPLMGKTWALTEMARRLLEEGRYLVGYHESKAAENSHLLYAVSNLYARWLADSTMREQAVSLWERHRDSLVPRVGQMVGMLFDKLGGKLLAEGVGAVVGAAFDGLAEARKDLLSGGIPMAPLPYDQALSLISLVSKISQRRIVLILDAWEKSPSARSEFATLEAFLKHQESWPPTHIFVAVRNPELDSMTDNEEAYQRVQDLCRLNRAATLYELGQMTQDDVKERDRLIRFVRNSIPATRDAVDQSLLQMIDGYPGVLDFWTSENVRTAMRSEGDLRTEAGNAQALRYVELDELLNELEEPLRTLAARLAFFPRLDAERWALFRDLLLIDQSDEAVNQLIDHKVLNDDQFPTYGHDTRHMAARRWFIEHCGPLVRRISDQVIEALASRITGLDRASRPFYEALVGCSESARRVRTNPALCCLLDAAQSGFGDLAVISDCQFDLAYPKALRHNSLFSPLIASALLFRGFEKAQGGDHAGALSDYSAVIELPNVPVEQLALALVGRGLGKIQGGDGAGALSDYTAVIELPNAPVELVALALFNRGIEKGRAGDSAGAQSDYSAAIELPNAPVELVAQALVNRGVEKDRAGDNAGAQSDFTAVIKLPNAPVEPVALALWGRSVVKGQSGDSAGAQSDYTAMIELPNAPVNQVAWALLNRGIIRGESGDSAVAQSDFTAVIGLPGAPAEVVEAARRLLADRAPASSMPADGAAGGAAPSDG